MTTEDIARAAVLARELLALLEKNMEVPPEVPVSEPTSLTVSQYLSKQAYEKAMSDGDPPYEDLPADIVQRMEEFSRFVRNTTLQQISGAIEKAYGKFTETVVSDIRKKIE